MITYLKNQIAEIKTADDAAKVAHFLTSIANPHYAISALMAEMLCYRLLVNPEQDKERFNLLKSYVSASMDGLLRVTKPDLYVLVGAYNDKLKEIVEDTAEYTKWKIDISAL